MQERPTLFISGVAGIGKSEFAKYYADKNRKKYTNIIYLYYAGDLKKSIAGMGFDDDTSEMTEEMLFDKHYKILKKLHHDSLIILDNFNILPKDDSFFREFAQNDFQLLITTRCRPTQYPIMELKELDTDTELPELFYRLCPSAKKRCTGYKANHTNRTQPYADCCVVCFILIRKRYGSRRTAI